MATLDTRKFLDYNGLETFWTGIKNKFAEQTTVTGLQNTVDGLNEQFVTLNNDIISRLENILAQVDQKSPLIEDNYTAAVAAAKNALPGSVIYVKYSEGNYNSGPYIVTANKELLYIPTRDGNIDFEDTDAKEILDKIAGLREEFNSFKADYATKDELREAIAGVQGSGNGSVKIQVVTTLPEIGEVGTIYLVPNNLNDSTNQFTEHIYVDHGGIKVYEKIGVGLEDLKNYVKSDKFTEKIQEINTAITTAKNDAINTVQNGIISLSDDSFGNTMAISESDIVTLLNTII